MRTDDALALTSTTTTPSNNHRPASHHGTTEGTTGQEETNKEPRTTAATAFSGEDDDQHLVLSQHDRQDQTQQTRRNHQLSKPERQQETSEILDLVTRLALFDSSSYRSMLAYSNEESSLMKQLEELLKLQKDGVTWRKLVDAIHALQSRQAAFLPQRSQGLVNFDAEASASASKDDEEEDDEVEQKRHLEELQQLRAHNFKLEQAVQKLLKRNNKLYNDVQRQRKKRKELIQQMKIYVQQQNDRIDTANQMLVHERYLRRASTASSRHRSGSGSNEVSPATPSMLLDIMADDSASSCTDMASLGSLQSYVTDDGVATLHLDPNGTFYTGGGNGHDSHATVLASRNSNRTSSSTTTITLRFLSSQKSTGLQLITVPASSKGRVGPPILPFLELETKGGDSMSIKEKVKKMMNKRASAISAAYNTDDGEAATGTVASPAKEAFLVCGQHGFQDASFEIIQGPSRTSMAMDEKDEHGFGAALVIDPNVSPLQQDDNEVDDGDKNTTLNQLVMLGMRLIALDGQSVEEEGWSLGKVRDILSRNDAEDSFTLTFRRDRLSRKQLSVLQEAIHSASDQYHATATTTLGANNNNTGMMGAEDDLDALSIEEGGFMTTTATTPDVLEEIFLVKKAVAAPSNKSLVPSFLQLNHRRGGAVPPPPPDPRVRATSSQSSVSGGSAGHHSSWEGEMTPAIDNRKRLPSWFSTTSTTTKPLEEEGEECEPLDIPTPIPMHQAEDVDKAARPRLPSWLNLGGGTGAKDAQGDVASASDAQPEVDGDNNGKTKGSPKQQLRQRLPSFLRIDLKDTREGEAGIEADDDEKEKPDRNPSSGTAEEADDGVPSRPRLPSWMPIGANNNNNRQEPSEVDSSSTDPKTDKRKKQEILDDADAEKKSGDTDEVSPPDDDGINVANSGTEKLTKDAMAKDDITAKKSEFTTASMGLIKNVRPRGLPSFLKVDVKDVFDKKERKPTSSISNSSSANNVGNSRSHQTKDSSTTSQNRLPSWIPLGNRGSNQSSKSSEGTEKGTSQKSEPGDKNSNNKESISENEEQANHEEEQGSSKPVSTVEKEDTPSPSSTTVSSAISTASSLVVSGEEKEESNSDTVDEPTSSPSPSMANKKKSTLSRFPSFLRGGESTSSSTTDVTHERAASAEEEEKSPDSTKDDDDKDPSDEITHIEVLQDETVVQKESSSSSTTDASNQLTPQASNITSSSPPSPPHTENETRHGVRAAADKPVSSWKSSMGKTIKSLW